MVAHPVFVASFLCTSTLNRQTQPTNSFNKKIQQNYRNKVHQNYKNTQKTQRLKKKIYKIWIAGNFLQEVISEILKALQRVVKNYENRKRKLQNAKNTSSPLKCIEKFNHKIILMAFISWIAELMELMTFRCSSFKYGSYGCCYLIIKRLEHH